MSAKALILDSSVWIEILNRGPLEKACVKEFNAAGRVFVPTLVLYEVYRKIAVSYSEEHALSSVTTLSQNEVVDMSREIALAAADLSIQYKLAMVDSIVLAHAHQSGAELLTLDNDFSDIPGTQVLRI